MALDTVGKRQSAIAISSPWRSSLPIPDGTVGQGDRQHFALYCSAVAFSSATLFDYDVDNSSVFRSQVRHRLFSSQSRDRIFDSVVRRRTFKAVERPS